MVWVSSANTFFAFSWGAGARAVVFWIALCFLVKRTLLSSGAHCVAFGCASCFSGGKSKNRPQIITCC